MRLTLALLRRNLVADALHYKRNLWITHRQRKVTNDGTSEYIRSLGHEVQDALEFIKEDFPWRQTPTDYEGPPPDPFAKAEPPKPTSRRLHYNMKSTLVNGLIQAEGLTKTVAIKGLPKTLVDLVAEQTAQTESSEDLQEMLKQIVVGSVNYDAWQEKLPRELVEVERPEYISIKHKRQYGVPFERRCGLLFDSLSRIAARLGPPNILFNRTSLEDVSTCLHLDKDGIPLVFTSEVARAAFSSKPLRPMATNEETARAAEVDIPVQMYPVSPMASLKESLDYPASPHFPMPKTHNDPHLHTIVLANLLPEKVLPLDAKLARPLVHSFAWAAAHARTMWGSSITKLPEPVTIQCIHTDGQDFNFSCFQLNTLDINGCSGVKNFYWFTDPLVAYESMGFRDGLLFCDGFDETPINHFLAFLRNQ